MDGQGNVGREGWMDGQAGQRGSGWIDGWMDGKAGQHGDGQRDLLGC